MNAIYGLVNPERDRMLQGRYWQSLCQVDHSQLALEWDREYQVLHDLQGRVGGVAVDSVCGSPKLFHKQR